MRAAAIVIAAAVLAGCSNVDRAEMTRFEALGGTEFRYSANAGSSALSYAVDSPSAEATRREWLEQYLHDNRLCPAGYEIVERRPVVTGTYVAGTAYRIDYRGRCKS